MTEFLNTLLTWVTSTGIKIVIALIVLLVSFKIINVVFKKLAQKLVTAKNLDQTLTKTLCNAGKIAMKIIVVVCLIGYLGIETSGISAVIASLGVCVGLAVNGTLSNLAGGVMLLLTRPFKVGDYIKAQDQEGIVEDILICTTKINTLDNKVVYLPNSSLSTGSIVNYSEKELRRVDFDFSVAGNDPTRVRELLLSVCENEELVLNDPIPFARISDYGAGNGVKVTLRAWCKSAEYWDTYFALLDTIQKTFEAEGIVIPFNQLDVHIKN